MAAEGCEESKLIFREATASDQEAVLSMHQTIYDGLDYLAAMYEHLAQQQRNHLYLLALDGPGGAQVVSFAWCFLLDNGRRVSVSAARTHPAHQSRGYYSRLKRLALADMKRRYPDIQLVVGTNHREEALLPSLDAKWALSGTRRVGSRYVDILHGKVSRHEIAAFRDAHPPAGRWLAAADAATLLSDEHLSTRLFGASGLFNWNCQPCCATADDVLMYMERFRFCAAVVDAENAERPPPSGVQSLVLGSEMAVQVGARIDYMHFGRIEHALPMFALVLERLLYSPSNALFLPAVFLFHVGTTAAQAAAFYSTVSTSFPAMTHLVVDGNMANIIEQPFDSALEH